MNRRSKEVSGWVNFPVESTEYLNSNEGGMFVKLVVVKPKDSNLSVCCGTIVQDSLQECLIGDDKRKREISKYENISNKEEFEECLKKDREWEEYHYPRINSSEDPYTKYLSIPYFSVIILGSTGWSGYGQKEEEYWICRYSDLTVQGKDLYNQIQLLYSGCDLHLLTFLDT